MRVEAERLVTSLRLAAETEADLEPLGEADASPVRATLHPPSGPPITVLVRIDADAEAEANNAAMLEALARAGFDSAPKVLGFYGDAAIETWVDGLTALSVVPPPGSAEAAIDAIARLHALDLREGLRWAESPGDWLAEGELPLYRLGFAAEERDAARGPIAEAISHLRIGPWGLAHGDCTAACVLLAPDKATLTAFGEAGFGPQLCDVAAFLLTAGLDVQQRKSLAARYASARGWDAGDVVDGIDLAGIIWGLGELLLLPRRLIAALGDDPLSAALRTTAQRIEQGIAEPAGQSPIASAIRKALWG